MFADYNALYCGESKILSFPVIAIDHVRFGLSLCFKTRLSAKLLTTSYFFILMQIKLIFSRKDFHLASFERESFCNSARWHIIQYP